VTFHVAGLDHTGLTVTDIQRSIRLWRDVLGFTHSRTFEITGDFAAGLTGRAGAHTTHAIGSREGRAVELVECLSPHDTEHLRPRPCDVGSVRVALTVDGMHAAPGAPVEVGCTPVGAPQPIPDGTRRGSLFVYVHGPDRVTIELIQLTHPGT